MKSLITAAAAVTTALLLGACSVPNIGGEEHPAFDSWGNETRTSEPMACTVPGASPLAPPLPGSAFDPLDRQKPLDTPPGHNWVTMSLRVVALSPDLNKNYCVPIHVHYEKRTAEPDLFINGQGPVVVEDFYTTTPWRGYVSFDYDPTQERFAARPPMYGVTLTATYLPLTDTLNVDTPIALGCHIQLFGANVAGDMITPLTSGSVCVADLVNDYFNLA
jgi:hypothetical protein